MLLALEEGESLPLDPDAALANPQGGTVSAGQAGISESGKKLNVTQSSNKVVIDWRGFDIAPDEWTQFYQPSASSIALNRVNSNSASHIDGRLTANGNVIIVNQNGVMFGAGAKVDVNGLIATTADIDNNKFMNSTGSLTFDKPGNPNASIINNGTITARDAGLVGLVAPNVINNGVIIANLGRVHLASGDTVTVDMYGDSLMEVAVSDQVKSQLVSNSGLIEADGGKIALTAAAGNQIVTGLINVAGELKAPSVAQQNGEIYIAALGSNAVAGNVAADKGVKQGSSTVLVSGTLDASGKNPGEHGGEITVTGDNVALLHGSVLDASGSTGGGTVKVGGDYHGGGDTPAALTTYVDSGVLILADALDKGDGGNVTVWADSVTGFYGSIEAKGGLSGGNGGFVETSGKQILDMQGSVTASAANGNAGTWLLDPYNATISNTATANPGYSANWTANSGGNVNTADIDNSLNGGTSVNVTASGSITVQNNILQNSGGHNNVLTLNAGSDIVLNSGVSISSTSGKLGVTLDADTAGSGGAIVLSSGSSISSNGGNITLGGGANPATGPAVGDATYTSGINLTNATINAGGGNISLQGKGYSPASGDGGTGISVDSLSHITTNSTGTISLTGTGGNGSTGGYGSYRGGTGGTGISIAGSVTSVSGAISMTGNGGTGGGSMGGYGSYGGNGGTGISMTGSVTSTSGAISMTGNGGSGGNGSDSPGGFTSPGGNGGNGISLAGSVSTGGAGSVSITGTGGNGGGGGGLGGGDYNGSIGSAILLGGDTSVTGGSGGVAFTGAIYGSVNNTQSLTVNAIGGGASFSSTVSAFGEVLKNLSITADSLTLGGSIYGSGALTIAPSTASTVLNINDGTSSGLYLTNSELGYIKSGWSGVTFGSSSGTGAVNMGAETLVANTTIQSGSGNITFSGAQTLGTKALTAVTTSGSITLAQNAKIVSTATSGNSIVLAAGGNFINNDSNDGAGALNAGTGTARYLVYSTDPSLNTMGGLSDAGKHVFNKTYSNYAPGSVTQTGNLFLYSLAPTITVTADNQSRLYGQGNPSLTYTLSGFVDGDTGSVISGAPTISTAATATTNVGTAAITAALNNLADSIGYQFAAPVNGTLTINKAHLTVTADNKSMTYGGAVLPSLTDTIPDCQWRGGRRLQAPGEGPHGARRDALGVGRGSSNPLAASHLPQRPLGSVHHLPCYDRTVASIWQRCTACYGCIKRPASCCLFWTTGFKAPRKNPAGFVAARCVITAYVNICPHI